MAHVFKSKGVYGDLVLRDDWHAKDIMEVAGKPLTKEQVENIMIRLVEEFDVYVGINWEVIQQAIDKELDVKQEYDIFDDIEETHCSLRDLTDDELIECREVLEKKIGKGLIHFTKSWRRKVMTEDELKDMILECICYLIEDGSMNELLRDVIMDVLTDTTPYVKVAVH